MQIIQGKYKNGRIRLSRKPKTSKEVDVTVLIPRVSAHRKTGLTKKEVRKLIGLVDLGGDALLDTERLYS